MRSLFSILGIKLSPFVRKAQDDKGFSLLEVSIALALMGVVGATALPYLSQQRDRGRISQTLSNQDVVFASLANYALVHGRLPCPAASSAKGIARQVCSDASTAIGGVPYATLGLSKNYAHDGWRHPYIYAVNPDLTGDLQNDQAIDMIQSFCKVKGSPLKISLPSSKSLPAPEDDPFAVILISRGEAGMTPKGKEELVNEEKTFQFSDFPYCTKADSVHRHRLKWWTRNNLLSHYAQFSCPGFLRKHHTEEKEDETLTNTKDEDEDESLF